MRLSASAALCAILAAACAGGESATAPVSGVDLSAAKPRTYQATLLPLPPGATSSRALAINAKGQVVGLVDEKAVRWDPGALPVELGIFPGHESSRPIGISDRGDVLGSGSPPQDEPHIPLHVIRWPAAGGIEDLGEMCCDALAAADINSQGEIAWVGWVTGAIQANAALHLLSHGNETRVEVPDEGFRLGLRVLLNDHGTVAADELVWSSHAGWSALTSAYSDPGAVQIRGINDHGDIIAVEQVFISDVEERGTLYPNKGTPVPFGLDFAPASINDFGVIAGQTDNGARLRYPDGTMVSLPTPSGLGAGPVSLALNDISNSGVVVGTASGTIGGVEVQRATIWRPLPGHH